MSDEPISRRRVNETVEKVFIRGVSNLRYGIDVPIAKGIFLGCKVIPMPDELPMPDGRPPCGDCGTICELDSRDMVWVCPACHRVQKEDPLPEPPTNGVDGDGI